MAGYFAVKPLFFVRHYIMSCVHQGQIVAHANCGWTNKKNTKPKFQLGRFLWKARVISEISVYSEVYFGLTQLLSESSSESCSESSEASFCSGSEDFQSYDDSAEPIATEEEATQYSEQIAVEEEKEPEEMHLSRFADETDLSDWYFIWFLRFDSFCFCQCVYFCKKKSYFPICLLRRKLRTLDSICRSTFRSGWSSRGECARTLTTYLAHFIL